MDSDNSRSVSVPLEEDLDLIGVVDDDDYNSSERHEIDAFISAAILAEASSSRTKDKERCKGSSSLKSTLSRDSMSQWAGTPSSSRSMTMIKKDSTLDSKENERDRGRDRDREMFFRGRLVDDRGAECEDAVPVGMVRDMGLELDVDRPRNMARIGRDRSLGPNEDVDRRR